jgi:hypothetical protein
MLEFLGFASLAIAVLVFARLIMGGLADKSRTKESDRAR